jgi:hypothetical protein
VWVNALSICHSIYGYVGAAIKSEGHALWIYSTWISVSLPTLYLDWFSWNKSKQMPNTSSPFKSLKIYNFTKILQCGMRYYNTCRSELLTLNSFRADPLNVYKAWLDLRKPIDIPVFTKENRYTQSELRPKLCRFTDVRTLGLRPQLGAF